MFPAGLFNTIGRFVCGPLAMIPHLSPLRVHNALLFTAGILTVLAAYAYNLTTCALYAGLCGFAIGKAAACAYCQSMNAFVSAQLRTCPCCPMSFAIVSVWNVTQRRLEFCSCSAV